ncbi:MAG: hypothetical protein KatS3mg024_1099 [Armatimonadota bacterium]|nr:MAG: hypothetical protein KatS3mg024_1099 [Armatimonadota bacterium]
MPARLILPLLCFAAALAADCRLPVEAAPVRILLTAFGPAQGVSISAAGLEISTDGKTWRAIQSGNAPLLEPGETLRAPVMFRGAAGTVSLSRGPLARSYRGIIEVSAGPSPAIVNVVELEDYLRSVVPSEMPSSWPVEALKAQAVAARSYTLGSSPRHGSQGAHVCDTTHCQAYRGTDAERPATDRAVLETRGMVLMRQGRIVAAQFCADCGGVAAPASGSRADALEDGTHFCEASPSHRWSTRISQETMLRALGEERPGAIRRIRIEARDESGRITSITIEHDFGRVTLTGPEMRGKLGPAGIRSTLCWFEADSGTGDILVSGLGNGHGEGLCQWGARGRALPPHGHDFRAILAHYFPEAQLATLDASGRPGPAEPLSDSQRAP